MNRLKFFSIIFIIATVLFLPVILWFIKPEFELNVAIIDKTVPNIEYREHEGLVWVLNNEKFINPVSQKPYSYEKDYYGFFPEKNGNFTTINYNSSNVKPDLVYITDTYGVYDSDFRKTNKTGERSELLYGGIDSNEIEAMRKSIYQGSTVIAEFNTFATPTNIDARRELYDLLGIKWSGWIGRYFNNLSQKKEIPDWAVSNYETLYKKPWNFKGSGIIFVNEDDKIIVLEAKDLLEKGVNFKSTEQGEQFFSKSIDVKYDYWFDIIETPDISKVLASYNIALSDSAKAVLSENNIPTEFPAVIKQSNSKYISYYFAGDYSDYPDVPRFYQLSNWSKLMEKIPLPRSDTFFWKAYVPMMKTILEETKNRLNSDPEIPKSVATLDNINMVSRTNNTMLQVYSNEKWEDIFIKGVNLGTALPGKWFTEFPKHEDIYLQWFEDIGKMNANTIRVYTLMDPAFYRALLKYNDNHPQNPIWLLQEVWPEEHPKDKNYLTDEYVSQFHKEIEYVIDAVHGNLSLSERKGRAYGNYYADVSKYTLGFLVGRELEPEEVSATNKLNEPKDFNGSFLSTSSASATEAWLAMSCDYLINYQTQKYAWQHPVAIVSWPTLDALTHDSEWNNLGTKEYNDREQIDIRHFKVNDNFKAGFFGAYHIYPNYPDFMNNTLEYASYKDAQGTLNYGGYLKQFMEIHTGYPALVAEFGLATGMGNAHHNPDGYHHGSMTEKQQGEGIVRMMEAIKTEDYAGGLIFEWMDEWAKKTWTTEPFIIPYEHNVFWHNAMDPEQNYGILAAESKKPEVAQMTMTGSNMLEKVELRTDETYVYIDIKSSDKIDLNTNKLFIGLDTYDSQKGSHLYSPTISLNSPTGMEFLVELSEKNASLLTIPEYNIGNYRFASTKNANNRFERIMPIVNSKRVTKDGRFIPEIRNDNSRLNKGDFNQSFYHWNQNNDTISLRLPWALLNITDPTTHRVLNDVGIYSDYPARDTLETATTDGIRFTFLLTENNTVYDQLPNNFEQAPKAFLWPTWGEPNPNWRLKESYYIIQNYFKNN